MNIHIHVQEHKSLRARTSGASDSEACKGHLVRTAATGELDVHDPSQMGSLWPEPVAVLWPQEPGLTELQFFQNKLKILAVTQIPSAHSTGGGGPPVATEKRAGTDRVGSTGHQLDSAHRGPTRRASWPGQGGVVLFCPAAGLGGGVCLEPERLGSDPPVHQITVGGRHCVCVMEVRVHITHN